MRWLRLEGEGKGDSLPLPGSKKKTNRRVCSSVLGTEGEPRRGGRERNASRRASERSVAPLLASRGTEGRDPPGEDTCWIEPFDPRAARRIHPFGRALGSGMEAWWRSRRSNEERKDERIERRTKMIRCSSDLSPTPERKEGSASFGGRESPLVRVQKALFCSPSRTTVESRSPLSDMAGRQNGEDASSDIKRMSRTNVSSEIPSMDQDRIQNLVQNALERSRSKVSRILKNKPPMLPTVDDCAYGPSRISVDTLADVLQDPERWEIPEYLIIDCRYPYEYDGGHVKGAINLHEPADVEQAFLGEESRVSHCTAIIFHCEFSSQRAPKMYGHIRNLDRKLNLKNYPRLDFPHMYIMDGGYKEFFSKYEWLCEGGYTTMCDPQHKEKLKVFHTRYKSLWQDRGMSHRGSY